ncbi:MAG: PDZ domain-containing protein [Polyangiales bacterium]
MSRHSRTLAALVMGCALLTGCGGAGRGQPVGGIHAKLAYSEGGGLRVVQVPAGGAADLAGMRPDDVIIAINGTSVRELDYQAIVERLRGPVGSSVQLDLFREGDVRTVVVMRQAYSK